jgi:hypothetical protein
MALIVFDPERSVDVVKLATAWHQFNVIVIARTLGVRCSAAGYR